MLFSLLCSGKSLLYDTTVLYGNYLCTFYLQLDYENKEVIDAHVKSILNTTLPNTDGKYERLSPIEAYKIAPEELTKSMEMEQQVYATPCKHVDCGAVYCQPSNNEQKIYEEFEGKRFCQVFHEEIELVIVFTCTYSVP